MSELAGFPLNGCDAFMLAMDDAMKRSGGSQNLCHLLITLEPGTDPSPLAEQIREHPSFREVSRLRLSRPLLRAPRWHTRCTTNTPEPQHSTTSCVSEEHLHEEILSRTLDPHRDSPCGVIAVPLFHRGPSLLFYWHHALCDAHGGELFVKRIITAPESCPTPLTPTPTLLASRGKALRRARTTKDLIFKKAARHIARIAQSPEHPRRLTYAHITYTPEQTSRIDQTITQLTGGMFPTALYLAATARALSRTGVWQRQSDHPLFVPVPHDMRRTTKQRSPLSNQVSVAFFRLTPQASTSLLETTNEVIEQLHETIADHHHHGMLDFLRLIRRLPPRLLWKIIEYPTAGHPASFYFSDIGSSLSTINAVYGSPIRYATHYPPNLAPPGFTTVWSRYRGSLEVRICYDHSSLSDASLLTFRRHLNEELLGAIA